MVSENEPETPNTDPGYTLTHHEQAGFSALNAQIVNAKLAVYNLTVALEKARKDSDKAEAQFGGALAFLANSHGMSQCQIAPDFSRIQPPQGV